jgi:hypothetical protein
MTRERPNKYTQDVLADPEIRDRAEDAARSLQSAAREREATTRHPDDPRRTKKR